VDAFFCTLPLYAILSTNCTRCLFGTLVVEDCEEEGGCNVLMTLTIRGSGGSNPRR